MNHKPVKTPKKMMRGSVVGVTFPGEPGIYAGTFRGVVYEVNPNGFSATFDYGDPVYWDGEYEGGPRYERLTFDTQRGVCKSPDLKYRARFTKVALVPNKTSW